MHLQAPEICGISSAPPIKVHQWDVRPQLKFINGTLAGKCSGRSLGGIRHDLAKDTPRMGS